ncbi:DUF308 domain-containing protein [Candidatus Saccharibacteria bacterium]|nr:DUF308 domain-containing protein [Candidatus Saccharibacteria bacterium]MBQ3436480.1 DUF308 domain-containing protein [Candidatus Saccharibacteria bacterium]
MSKVEIIKRPAEQVSGDIKKSAWSAIIESLALIILGILFVVLQDTMVQVLSYIVGAFFIVKGGFQIINYFMEKGQNDFFNNDLLSGVVSVLIGIAALVIGADIAHIFRVVIGIIIIYESLVRINTASKLATAKISAWKYIMIIALIMLVLGVFVTFYTGAVVILVGWMMILTGVVGIVGDVMFIQYVNTLVEKLTGAHNG